MQVAARNVVYIHYTLKNDAGELLDKSPSNEPLGYLHGAGNILPGLESALHGKAAGDSLNVSVSPPDAYGERDETLVQDVPRGAFEGVDSIEPGMRFQAESPQGPRLITVRSVAQDVVTVDGNHPLAGETLVFDVQVEHVRAASEEELAHGHAHPEQGSGNACGNDA